MQFTKTLKPVMATLTELQPATLMEVPFKVDTTEMVSAIEGMLQQYMPKLAITEAVKESAVSDTVPFDPDVVQTQDLTIPAVMDALSKHFVIASIDTSHHPTGVSTVTLVMHALGGSEMATSLEALNGWVTHIDSKHG